MANQHIGSTDFEPDHHRGYEFGDYVLDLDRCALLKAGQDTGLPRESVHVLALLVEHEGVPVSKEDIKAHFRGAVPVGSEDISDWVSQARRVLDDEDSKVLRTLPGGRYIFERSVHPLEELAIAPRLDKRNYMEHYAMVLIALIVLMFLGLKLLDSPGDADGAVPGTTEERGR